MSVVRLTYLLSVRPTRVGHGTGQSAPRWGRWGVASAALLLWLCLPARAEPRDQIRVYALCGPAPRMSATSAWDPVRVHDLVYTVTLRNPTRCRVMGAGLLLIPEAGQVLRARGPQVAYHWVRCETACGPRTDWGATYTVRGAALVDYQIAGAPTWVPVGDLRWRQSITITITVPVPWY